MANPDDQYLDLVRRVLAKGDERRDRTGIGTKSIFGEFARFDLTDGQMPILTTKRIYWKTAIREMLWFLTGKTNIQDLLKNNVKIWSDWPLAQYRKTTGDPISQESFEARIVADDAFAKQWGDLGPVYGKQWRRWLDSEGHEHDQIGTLIDTLKTDPASRRMLFHAWNVGDLEKMALPPCHMVYQFHVNARNELSCLLLQRSADVFTGVPFNWTGAAALVHMIAQQAGLTPGELIWVGGDVHIYLNHLDQMHAQLAREPRSPPTMRLARRADTIDEYRIEDFVVEGYDPHPPIHGEVAV